MTPAALLQFQDYRVAATARHREDVPILQGIDLSIAPGQSVGVVGESGSGKSMMVKSAMRLLPDACRSEGSITFDGEDVLTMRGRALARYRSHDVALVHQDPRAHTNPVRTIGDFLVEGVVAARQMSRDEALAAAATVMREIGIADPERRLRQYPHELSGGLLQRMMIVMAMLPSPRLVFADEPTTALDVTVQAEVMAILMEQVRERHLALLLISHDLDLAAAVTDRLAVMYAGLIVESGATDTVYGSPRHPYTIGLIRARPRIDAVVRLDAIPGRPASAAEAGTGCVFAARCPLATAHCRAERPVLREVDGREVACHYAGQVLVPAAVAS